jgi:RNA polymerase sigma-70 factor (ECF subfamily)
VKRLRPDALGEHLDRLYRAAWALCGSREDAEDLVQETYARVLARPRLLRNDNELGYLLRVLSNTYLTQRRTASRRPQITTTLEQIHAADPRADAQPEQALSAREVYAVIAELPEPFRVTLVAVDIVGLSYREAARSLGAREATITTRLHRARQRIALVLEEPRGATRALGPAPAADDHHLPGDLRSCGKHPTRRESPLIWPHALMTPQTERPPDKRRAVA